MLSRFWDPLSVKVQLRAAHEQKEWPVRSSPILPPNDCLFPLFVFTPKQTRIGNCNREKSWTEKYSVQGLQGVLGRRNFPPFSFPLATESDRSLGVMSSAMYLVPLQCPCGVLMFRKSITMNPSLNVILWLGKDPADKQSRNSVGYIKAFSSASFVTVSALRRPAARPGISFFNSIIDYK